MNPDIIIETDSVIKRFRSVDSFDRELRIYQLCLPFVPRLISFSGTEEIVLERIPGIPYLDDREFFDPFLLGQTIALFHQATSSGDKCICHMDNNPKNILRSEAGYFLIDFSESGLAYPESDLTHLLLFWIGHFPDKDLLIHKAALIQGYSSIRSLNQEHWNTYIGESYDRFVSRREQYGKPLSAILSDRTATERLLRL
ncbi:MAG TPA: phosphotransferase [Candidatus Cloacimonadota bacterium]|nr:phosphotransferase [Candidatus Cloacimonadota bacterium]